MRTVYIVLGLLVRIKILSSNRRSISFLSLFYHFSLRIFELFYFSLTFKLFLNTSF